jgi:hypothetical protein
VAERVADAWDGVPVDEDRAMRVEQLILPTLQALVELADADDPAVVAAAVSDVLTTAQVALSSH